MEKDNTSKGSNEIDLFDLLIKFVRFTRKNILFIAICILTGLLLSVTYFYSQSKKYEATLLLNFKFSSKQIIVEIINGYISDNIVSPKIDSQFSKSNYPHIKKISIDTSTQNFLIKFILADTTNFNSIILNFTQTIDNNYYFNKKASQYLNTQKLLLKELNKKIGELDSIQNQIKNNLFANKKDFISVNPYYTEYFKLFEWKVQIENTIKDIEIKGKITVTEILKNEVVPLKSNPILILTASFFVSIVMAYFILFVVKIWKLSK